MTIVICGVSNTTEREEEFSQYVFNIKLLILTDTIRIEMESYKRRGEERKRKEKDQDK